MNGVDIRPQDVQQFAHHLDRLRNELAQLTKQIDDKAKDLGHSWSDGHFAQFYRRYVESMSVLHPFLKQAGDYARYLELKAARAQKAREHRF